jgi:hypothetical protein
MAGGGSKSLARGSVVVVGSAFDTTFWTGTHHPKAARSGILAGEARIEPTTGDHD